MCADCRESECARLNSLRARKTGSPVVDRCVSHAAAAKVPMPGQRQVIGIDMDQRLQRRVYAPIGLDSN
jgi:hypothetical protein